MHELSLAGGILDIVEATARRERFARVTLLRIEAGALCGVEVRALRFALEVMASETCLEHACIEIETPPGLAWCMQCQTNVEMMARGDPCAVCGNVQLQLVSGDALRVIEMMVEDT